MPSSMRSTAEPFTPQSNGSGTSTSPQQQQQTRIRNGSRTPPQHPVEMPATNGNGRSFPTRFQTHSEVHDLPNEQGRPVQNGSTAPAPQERQETDHDSTGSRTPVPRPRQIPVHNGNGPQPTTHGHPLIVNFESQPYIRLDEAARFFAQPNENIHVTGPHTPQLNNHHGQPEPQMNGFSAPFSPQVNGHNDQSFMAGPQVFRPETVPPHNLLLHENPLPREHFDTIMSHADHFHQFPPFPDHQQANAQYYSDYQYPTYEQCYQPMVQQTYPVFDYKPVVPSVPWFAPVYLRKKTSYKYEDPEAKLFVGDLPVRMTTEALGDALKRKFAPFGQCKVNVTWKAKTGPDGAVRSLPTGWIQYKTVFEAAKALDVAIERGFTIAKRPVRIDRADGKRICRMWPTNPHATLSLSNFKDAVRQYVDHIRCKSAYTMLYHVSDNIEMVDKNYGGRTFTVPSVGIVFRWVEDANYSEQKFVKFTHKFRLKIEHVNSGVPGWREGPMSLRDLDALILDTGEKWQEELILSRRRLRSKGEEFPGGKMARYPERISKKLIPRSILEHPRLRKDIYGLDPVDPLDWLDVHQEPPTPRALAINSKKLAQLNGQINGHCQNGANQQTKGEAGHGENGVASDRVNGESGHSTHVI